MPKSYCAKFLEIQCKRIKLTSQTEDTTHRQTKYCTIFITTPLLSQLGVGDVHFSYRRDVFNNAMFTNSYRCDVQAMFLQRYLIAQTNLLLSI